MQMEFRTIEPKILYFGNPVALISSLNEDGSTNLAPISSFWALGWTMVLGLLDETKTAENMERHAGAWSTCPIRRCGRRWRSWLH
jgi:flavin reductase (DIM6/NTAB) family NADH-FMN oxidoreductase RutF